MDDTRPNAIVTGAASGLGRALAVRLAHDGWRIALADVDAAGSQETLKRVEAAGGAGQIERLDVARLEDWESLRDRLRAEWSRLDLLVNNAGVAGYGETGSFPLDDWHWLMHVNLYGAIYGCHTLVDWLKDGAQHAHLINTASFAALAPPPSMAAYNVAKAGIVALSETLYAELRPHGVGVTVICPMFFRTGIHDAARSYDEVRSEIIEEGTERSKLTADGVADAAIRAMRRRQLYVIPGAQARWYWWLRRLAPRAFLNGAIRDVARRSGAKTDAAASGTRQTPDPSRDHPA